MLLKVLKPTPVVAVAFWVFLLSSGLNAQTSDALNIPALIEETETRTKEFGAKLRGYKYTLKRTEQELNAKNEVKSEKVTVYQVFPGPDGTVISMLVAENGKDLSLERLTKEKKRINKLWKKASEEARQKGKKTTPELISIFRASDFSMLRMDRLMEREMVVLRFSPKPAKSPKEFLSRFEGEMWIDLKDKALAKLDAKLSERYKVAGGFLFPAYLQPGTAIVIESAPLPDGIWVLTVLEFTPVGKISLAAKIPRTKQREERSDYLPFDQSVEELFPEP